MAKFDMVVPNDILKEFQTIYDNADDIFGKMTQAGAEVVVNNIRAGIPKELSNSEIMNCLKITKIYKTPSDDGINTKVGFYGYFINQNGVRTPAPLVANVFEYGSSKFTKHPFFRQSFKKSQIEQAMLKVQAQESGGLIK